ncbi:hypothetical protein ACH5RR_008651 [Cinchona calisaya]|uniref:Uncharacterized protein n=1 Tax=Cinchona calisaya TaxID=153742 RepID=A0ABD3ACB7_9GENT
MANDCWELSSNEVEDILEHVFGELHEIPSKVVSPLHEPFDLDFLQDNLDMRPKPRKFWQSMFAGIPLIGGASSSNVRVNMSRTTGPSTIVSSGFPQVHRARGQHLERENSNEEDNMSMSLLVKRLWFLFYPRGKRTKVLLSMKKKRKLRVILVTPHMCILNCLVRLSIWS